MTDSIASTEDVARAILVESMYRVNSLGWPIVEDPRYAVRCSMCQARVQAQVETSGPASTHYVLPVDSLGRCASCVLLLCEHCGGQEDGCQRCHWTGITGAKR